MNNWFEKLFAYHHGINAVIRVRKKIRGLPLSPVPCRVYYGRPELQIWKTPNRAITSSILSKKLKQTRLKPSRPIIQDEVPTPNCATFLSGGLISDAVWSSVAVSTGLISSATWFFIIIQLQNRLNKNLK